MGQRRFVKPEPADVQGTCVLCGERPQSSNGGGKFKPLCRACRKREFECPDARSLSSRRRRRPWLRHRRSKCERCGFEPEHICQLDVDHIDGDKTNNELTNLQTLCANCHCLKSLERGDYWPIELRAAA